MHFAKETRQKRANQIGRFVTSLSLGLMTRLTDVITDSVSAAVSEQKRCLRAIEEMVAVGKGHVQIARPQVSTCLVMLPARPNPV